MCQKLCCRVVMQTGMTLMGQCQGTWVAWSYHTLQKGSRWWPVHRIKHSRAQKRNMWSTCIQVFTQEIQLNVKRTPTSEGFTAQLKSSWIFKNGTTNYESAKNENLLGFIFCFTCCGSVDSLVDCGLRIWGSCPGICDSVRRGVEYGVEVPES